MSEPIFKVTIVFKSGYVYTDLFTRFKISCSGSDLTNVQWTLASPKQVLHLDLSDISFIVSELSEGGENG